MPGSTHELMQKMFPSAVSTAAASPILSAPIVDQNVNPLTEILKAYLNARNKMPTIQRDPTLDRATGGYFAASKGPNGIIGIGPVADATTLPHELTHAAVKELQAQRFDSTASSQYIDAAEKLLFNNAPAKTAQNLDPKWMSKQSVTGYRATSEELPAFAVGNQSPYPGNEVWRGGSHVDPTLATQMSILLELAQRKQTK